MKKADIRNILLGVGIGAFAALLLAPQAGKTTRDRIAKAAADGKGSLHGYGKSMQGAVTSIVERGKGYVFRHRMGITEALTRASKIYRRAA